MSRHERALVLGAGGALGLGWQVGLLTEWADAGVDLSDADFILGTSAGAAVGSCLASGRSAAEALDVLATIERQLRGGIHKMPAELEVLRLAALSETGHNARIAVGQAAVGAETVHADEWTTRTQHTYALYGSSWPDSFACTSVDIETGDRVVWDQKSEVSLGLAVAASGAAPLMFPPVTINGRRYIDGLVYSPLNADLARGYERVVALISFPLSGVDPDGALSAAQQEIAERELDVLHRHDARVLTIRPEMTYRTIIDSGRSVLDPWSGPAAYTAGKLQASAHTDELRRFWTS